MTTASTSINERPGSEPPGREVPSRSWDGIAISFAGEIARATFRRGDLAELRRMNPDAPDAAAFWRLMAEQDLLDNPALENKWALILHGIALMTPTAGGDNSPEARPRSAHDPTVSVGLALFQGGLADRNRAFYSETRLNRLLTARGTMLHSLLARLFRMLGRAGQPFNWREMANFILNDGYDEEAAERSRRQIARAYYQAERRSSPQSEE